MSTNVGAIRLAMAQLLAWRSVSSRPLRALLLCGGFGVGVGVMIVLLAVGEAMVRQASQERLVGGGTITVLPEGIDIEVLTTGGLGGLFFSVPNARFVHRHVRNSKASCCTSPPPMASSIPCGPAARFRRPRARSARCPPWRPVRGRMMRAIAAG